jgi:hypothetical protein
MSLNNLILDEQASVARLNVKRTRTSQALKPATSSQSTPYWFL